MPTIVVNARSLKRFGIVAVAVLAIIAALVLVFSPTDANRLKSEIEQRFPPTTKRQIVESWLASERITFDTVDHLGDTIGDKTVLEIERLTDDALGPTIRARQGLIFVYFFFDRSNKLIKYWLDDGRNAL
jgi:hypothetical protein